MVLMLENKVFKADEYAAIGLSNLNKDQWVDPEIRVRDFIFLYLLKKNFLGVAVFKNKFTSNFSKYSQSNKPYVFIESLSQAVKLKSELIKNSFSGGHLSTLFLLRANSDALREYLKKQYYKNEKIISLIKNDQNQPIPSEDLDSYFALLKELKIGSEFLGLTFSHDADYFYLIQ